MHRRLITHVAVVGADLDTLPSDVNSRTLPDTIPAKVLDCFPRRENDIQLSSRVRTPPFLPEFAELPPQLHSFVFPGGVKVRRCRPVKGRPRFEKFDVAPRFGSFALTDETGTCHYACYLCWHVPAHVAIFLSAAFVVVSRYPFYDEMKTVLRQLYRAFRAQAFTQPPLEQLIQHVVTRILVPPRGRRVHRVALGDSAVVLARAGKNEVPLLHTTDALREIYALPRRIGVGNFVRLFEALVAERPILLVSASSCELAESTELLKHTLFPLRFAGVCVPVLPAALLSVLYAPVPLIAGVSPEVVREHGDEIPWDDIVVADMAGCRVSVGRNLQEELPRLPEKMRRKLTKKLQAFMSQLPYVETSDLAFEETSTMTPLTARSCYNDRNGGYTDTDGGYSDVLLQVAERQSRQSGLNAAFAKVWRCVLSSLALLRDSQTDEFVRTVTRRLQKGRHVRRVSETTREFDDIDDSTTVYLDDEMQHGTESDSISTGSHDESQFARALAQSQALAFFVDSGSHQSAERALQKPKTKRRFFRKKKNEALPTVCQAHREVVFIDNTPSSAQTQRSDASDFPKLWQEELLRPPALSHTALLKQLPSDSVYEDGDFDDNLSANPAPVELLGTCACAACGGSIDFADRQNYARAGPDKVLHVHCLRCSEAGCSARKRVRFHWRRRQLLCPEHFPGAVPAQAVTPDVRADVRARVDRVKRDAEAQERADNCYVCGDVVNDLEQRVFFRGMLTHRQCARCTRCRSDLTQFPSLAIRSPAGKELHCARHYLTLDHDNKLLRSHSQSSRSSLDSSLDRNSQDRQNRSSQCSQDSSDDACALLSAPREDALFGRVFRFAARARERAARTGGRQRGHARALAQRFEQGGL